MAHALTGVRGNGVPENGSENPKQVVFGKVLAGVGLCRPPERHGYTFTW